jgi:hypothetical protein
MEGIIVFSSEVAGTKLDRSKVGWSEQDPESHLSLFFSFLLLFAFWLLFIPAARVNRHAVRLIGADPSRKSSPLQLITHGANPYADVSGVLGREGSPNG